MEITTLAAGSSGNAYLLNIDGKRCLLDAGLPFNRLNKLLNFNLPEAAFITHEHRDHAYCIGQLMMMGIDICMTYGTARALRLDHQNHRLHKVSTNKHFKTHGIEFAAYDVKHDAVEPCCFAFFDVNLLYLTDTGVIPELKTKFKKLMIECNYDPVILEECLLNGEISRREYQRIKETHLSINQVKAYIEANPQLEEVRLIHISKRHGDSEEFQRRVQDVTLAEVKAEE